MKVIFFKKCIWEIRNDNPSLAVKILNVTPRPILPSQRETPKKWANDINFFYSMHENSWMGVNKEITDNSSC